MTEEMQDDVVEEEIKTKPLRSRKKATPPPRIVRDLVSFESYGPESTQFKILGVRPIRSGVDRTKLIWRVPVELAERFERHFFVQTGRLVKLD